MTDDPNRRTVDDWTVTFGELSETDKQARTSPPMFLTAPYPQALELQLVVMEQSARIAKLETKLAEAEAKLEQGCFY